MTQTPQLAPWHRAFAGMLSGSVYAARQSARIDTAVALGQAGLDVHVDIMAMSEGLPKGVSVAELREIAAALEARIQSAVVKRSRIGVHLIGSPEFVDTTLRDVLRVRPATVFLPWAAFTEERARAVRAVGSAAWITLWNEWDGTGAPNWPAPPDGVLVMLIEPGTRERCALDRLPIVAECAAEMPVTVNGGITEDIAPLCVRAGVKSMVVGRALLQEVPAPVGPATTARRTEHRRKEIVR